jgi:hypothetical protein
MLAVPAVRSPSPLVTFVYVFPSIWVYMRRIDLTSRYVCISIVGLVLESVTKFLAPETDLL